MTLFKCKMCGGSLEIAADETIATCEYCGTQQTLPKLDDDRRASMYDRANHFRRNNEFDKANGIYEQILNDDNTDAEAYWSLVLCRYGIEYVEDPASHKRIPTVNRAQFTSIFDDDNYKSALQYADSYQRSIYEAEAKTINEIQKGFLAISQKEEPFDVFICYKESDKNGRRTPDSVLANDLYHQLTQEGFKVFFARITLEDKLGSAYEPYIFAALNSAKVMVVLGTKPEYFNAVWVKNEWSRYLALIKTGAKKMLIPAYKDMDPYDLPDEFSHLQAQDMSKLGFMQDLIRGIKKITQMDAPKQTVVKETVVSSTNTNAAPLLKRAFMFLEDGEWNRADEFCEQVLNIDPECAEAYLGKLMAELKVRKQENLKDYGAPFDSRNNYQKVLRFGDDKLKAELTGYIEHINIRNENARLDGIYTRAKNAMSAANTENAYKEAAHLFESISEYQDAATLAQTCYERAEVARKDAILDTAKSRMRDNLVTSNETAIRLLESIPGWKDADEQIIACRKKIEEIKALAEADRLERERKAEADRLEQERKAEADRLEQERIAKRNKKIAIIATPIVCAIIAFTIVLNTVIIPNGKYNDAIALMDAGKYNEAIVAFEALDGYKDSAAQIAACETAIMDGNYANAVALMDAGKYGEAIAAFEVLDGYKDSAAQIAACETAIMDGKYTDAVALMDAGKYSEALTTFAQLGSYRDSAEQINAIWNKITVRDTISAGSGHTVGLKADGTVVAVGSNGAGQCDVSGWTDIVAIDAEHTHTIGLKADGSVVAVGDNEDGKCSKVSGWKDIVAISAGSGHTVGLKADGSVVAVGDNMYGQCSKVSGWKDIVAIDAGYNHTVGLKADGTVVAVGYNGAGQCDVSGWKDIVAISAAGNHTVGLKADGSVVAVGDEYVSCDFSGWKNIVAISTDIAHTIGLKADGSVVAAGYNGVGSCDVSGWTDIVAISAGSNHTVGLKADGTVVAVGYNRAGQCDVSGWTDIKLPEK